MRLFSLLAALWAPAVMGNECPTSTQYTKSGTNGRGCSISMTNDVDETIEIYWVSFSGEEEFVYEMGPGQSGNSRSTFTNHVFRAYLKEPKTLLAEKKVVHEDGDHFLIGACGDLKAHDIIDGREEEFRALIDSDPTNCEGKSSKWSCLRFLKPEDVAKRDPSLYGFSKEEARGMRKEGDTKDEGYTSHIPRIPHIAGGYLKMNFTSKMRDTLLPFLEQKKGAAKQHEMIGGDYTNIHKIGMAKIDMDKFPREKQVIINEMQSVLQWWTQRRLKHTSTFGIRIYKRDSMLVNHVDRADTHLASAVLQVGQEDVDEGWPLEVLTPEGNTIEVYLQPGEMILYEGARLFHGRPMRFQGGTFANLFTHFAPISWKAVGRPWDDPVKEYTGPTHGEL